MISLKKKFPSLSSLGGDGNTSFLRSARAGNLEKVLEHLKNNIDINTCNTNGLNALHLASKDGHVHVVSELLKRGALVDSATKKGNTALHIASLAGQEEVVKLLLQSSASVNVQSQNGFTPLYMAAQENHDSVVKLLLANGANQSLATEDGFTPLAVAMQQGHDKVVAVLLESDTRGKVRLPALHIAAKKDDVKAATLLLENDHNPDITSKSGFTPLHIASHYGNQPIANLLIQKGADVNYLAKHNISPLHVAAKWGKTNMVSILLEKGANIEAKTRDGLTPLHCAARSGHEQVVDMLLERGAPISAKTKNGLAPLHMAAQGEHVDAARILLYHRAPVDEVTVDYLTALHVAAHCGHVRVAKLLLDRNADANARALNGFTPLHIACKKNRIKVVELLLRHGASISATTESGLTPLHVAAFMGCMNIVIYLLQHDASPDVPTVRGETPLHLAARANQTDIIRILLRNGAQVDARAREQQTPLHIASRLGNVDIVMLLLQHGVQVDATTKDMYTALHIAAKEGQDEVSSVLIENGAALDSSTKKGFTPLHLAAKYGHIKVTQLLLQKDAQVDAQGKNGVTPLHVACHYDKQNVALLLLERGASPHAPAKNGHTPLHIAARKNQMDIATTLLEFGSYADTESKAGFTPLHLSSQEGHAEISSLLIEHKANCNHAAKNGLTPMHLCAQEDNVNVAEVILRNGANVDMVTKAGYTPLHVASHFGQSNMVRFLLQNSADVDAATGIGYTPLHQAAQQGHCHIVNLLLEHRANANAQTANGQTPLHIARKLGYISVLDSLKSITNEDDMEMKETFADKYRVVAPEAMHETFMSDSEEEGGEDNALSDQPYRYLTVDEMKSLGDDSLPIDVTRDERIDSNRMTQSIENSAKPIIEPTLSPHQAQIHTMGNSAFDTIDFRGCNQEIPYMGRKLQWKNFLVSFLVDARGGAMRGCRHSGVKLIIPSRSTCQPTRVTCRYVKPQRTMHPPQLMEGEALASRVLELGPVSVKFQGPVVMEVPHFAALRGKEREIIILRSDNGETWREHTIDNADDIIQDIFNECFESEEINQLNEQTANHTCRFVTYDFPQYFAVVSRIRQEVHAIGSEGGMVTSTVVPQVQAVFPQGALTKKIKVGLQAQPVDPDLTAKLLGRGVAVSPIVTVEPRRRKFHKAITLSMPAPKAHSQGMINQYSGNTPTLRLLCSITGGASRAQWEDVTGSTPLTFVNECVSFTTTVSARFWLMDCRNISEATKMATELYREVIHVPFMAKFVVFAKRVESNEARLRVFCMTDDKEDKTLEKQEQYTEVAKSRDVEVLEGKLQYIEMAGNLVPVTKSGHQLQLMFKAFRENRLPFTVRVKDQHADIVGRTLFMKEPKIAKGEPPQHPICILNIILPEVVIPDQVQAKYQSDFVDIDATKYQNTHYIGEMRIVDLSNLLGKDYIHLAPEIGILQSEINSIVNRFPNSIACQAQDMVRIFREKPHYDINVLQNALRTIGREDILEKCNIAKNQYGTSLDDNNIEDFQSGTNAKHDRDEKKYSAEEKDVGESESDDENQKRTVAERRDKIVKRLSIERQIPASSQKKEIVQEITEIKRKSLIEDKKAIHEEEIMLQMPTDNIIKPTTTEQVAKMKLNKLETIDVFKNEIEKELVFKFKTTIKKQDEENDSHENSKIPLNNEVLEKENKYTANEIIRRSIPFNDTSDKSTCDEEEERSFKDSKPVVSEDKKQVIDSLLRDGSLRQVIYDDEIGDGKDKAPYNLPHTRTPPPTPIDVKDSNKTGMDKILLLNQEDISEYPIAFDVVNDKHMEEPVLPLQDVTDAVKVSGTHGVLAQTNGYAAKDSNQADNSKAETSKAQTVTEQTQEYEVDAIRSEATKLINNVLEESITILNQQRKTNATPYVENIQNNIPPLKNVNWDDKLAIKSSTIRTLSSENVIIERPSENILDNSSTHKLIPTTDTGGESAQHDCTEAIKRPAPKPTPRTYIAETDLNPVINKSNVPENLEVLSQNIDTMTELPIPKPRQQKSIARDQSDDNLSRYNVPRKSLQEHTVSSHQDSVSDEKSLDSRTEIESPIKNLAPIPSELYPSTITPESVLDTERATQCYQNNEQDEIVEPSAISNLEYSDSLEGRIKLKEEFIEKFDSDTVTHQDVGSVEICEEDLPTRFYIGESSTNIIQKSKPQKEQEEDDEEGGLNVALDEENATKLDTFAEDSFIDKFFTDVESDNKVIRQGSETRNDLLEIETELKKPLDNICTEITSQMSITTESAEITDQKIASTVEKKSVNLDLLLDKSEIELSEKSCAPTSCKLSNSITDTSETHVVIPDVYLVERTLEEVKLSLDAAKEELIQVVRDGKSIKQSPSEFEFKNMSHIKASISQHTEQGEEKCNGQINPILDDIPESHSPQIEENINYDIKSACSKASALELSKSFDSQHSAVKPTSPTNRWSLQDVDNSSSSESYYKSVSRPCSSEFDTTQTIHTSSEYQTALDASICRGSTEYVSAVSTFDNSGKTISSHESMKSFSSETSGNLGSIDTSDLSETLIASIGGENIGIEDDDSDVLGENMKPLSPDSFENDQQQTFMKRSEEMMFTTEISTIESIEAIPSKTENLEHTNEIKELSDEKILASSLDEGSILSMSSISTANTVVNNFEALIGSAGSSSLAGIDMFTSITEDDIIEQEYNNEYPDDALLKNISEIDDTSLSSDERKKRGHKRSESTLVSTDLLLNLLDEELASACPIDKDTNLTNKAMIEDQKGSGSESDQDPYESEYSRAFKSPSQRKKRKEKRHTEIFDQSPEHSITCTISPLVTQTIIEDIATEEIESHTIDERRRPSQNMHDYSNIPDITVTDEIMKYGEEIDKFPDSTLYKVKTQGDLNKVEDTPIQRTSEQAVSISDEQFDELVQQQYKQKLADLHESHEYESGAPDSPDSFEMVDQPDLSDEFVIIEEVAKEASELDLGGKSINIGSSKVIQKHDEEVEQILIKSAPAATNLGSQILRDDLNFDFEESPPQSSGQTEREFSDNSANKKWIEMQLSDHAAQLRYPYELERGVLEDIKEEESEFEVGSSRISSFKDSFSSTPDYDVLAGRKYFCKTEHDDISMNSLQEFESLEQAISLENRRIYQGSIESNNGSFTRRYMIRNAAGDDISLSSLKEFEGLENACIEAHLIEIKAREEAALLLSRSDESNNSNNGHESSQTIVAAIKTSITQSIPKDKIETILLSKLEECEERNYNQIQKSIDKTECEAGSIKKKIDDFALEQVSGDSLDINKSIEIATSSIDSSDISKDVTTKSDVDSLDPVSISIYQGGSADSLEQEQMSSLPNLKTQSINQTEVEHFVSTVATATLSTITSDTSFSYGTKISTEFSNDSLNLCAEQIDSNSVMTDSIASCTSMTLLEDSSGLEPTQLLLDHSHAKELCSDEVITDESSYLVKNVDKSADETK